MVEKTALVKSKLTVMFYEKQEYDRLVNEIDVIFHQMVGLKSPNLSGEHNTPEDRQHKLIRLGEKLTKLEKEKKERDIKFKSIYQELRINELNEQDYEFLSLRYKDDLTCEEIAYEYGYNSKQYVNKKEHNLLERLTVYI